MTGQQEQHDLVGDLAIAQPVGFILGITRAQQQAEHVIGAVRYAPGAAFADEFVDDGSHLGEPTT